MSFLRKITVRVLSYGKRTTRGAGTKKSTTRCAWAKKTSSIYCILINSIPYQTEFMLIYHSILFIITSLKKSDQMKLLKYRFRFDYSTLYTYIGISYTKKKYLKNCIKSLIIRSKKTVPHKSEENYLNLRDMLCFAINLWRKHYFYFCLYFWDFKKR